MGIASEVAVEGVVKSVCEELEYKIEVYGDNSEAIKAFKEIGIWALRQLLTNPDWAKEYYRLFRQEQQEGKGRKDEFDCDGLLFAIKEIETGYRLPLPEDIKKFGFCLVCLGSNVPGQKEYPQGGFRCGSWCDGFIPAWGICERFKVDRRKVIELAKSIRSDGTKETVSQICG